MEQTVQCERHGEGATDAVGDLRALLVMLDRPETVAPFDDGLHHLLTSIAALRRVAERRT